MASLIAALRDLAARGRDLLQQIAGRSAHSSSDPETADLVRRARDAHTAGRRDEETALLHEAGRIELAHGRAAAALSYFRAALRVDRDFLPSLVALGDA